MSLHFYAYARKGYEFIDDIAAAVKTDDIEKTGRQTRCVFRAMRNLLSPDDSIRLITQLPMALKGIYVDGWKLKQSNGFDGLGNNIITEVVREDAHSAWHDFKDEDEVKNIVLSVYKVLTKHIGSGEVENLTPLLPEKLREKFDAETKLKL